MINLNSVKIYFVLIIFFWGYKCNSQTKDHLLSQVKLAQNDSLKSLAYVALYKLYNETNIDSAIYYLEKASSYNLKTKTKEKLGDMYNSLGVMYRQNEDYSKSLENYNKSIQTHKLNKNPKEYSVKINKAILHLIKSEYTLAMEELIACLKYYETSKDFIGLGDTYKAMGRVAFYTNDTENALNYYFKAKTYQEKTKDYFSLSATMEAIGSTLMAQNKFKQAIEYHEKQLAIATEQNLESHMATAFNNIGECYLQIEEILKSIEYFEKSLNIRIRRKSIEGIISCYQKLSTAYLKLNNLEKALEYQEKAAEILKISSKNPKMQTEIYKNLFQINEKLGKDKEALIYYKKFRTLEDSLFGKNQLFELAKIKENYENEKKQNQINSLIIKLKLEETEREKQLQKNRILEFEKSTMELNNKLLTKEKLVQNFEIERHKKSIIEKNSSLKAREKALSQEKIIKWLLLGFLLMLLALISFIYYNFQKLKINNQMVISAKKDIEKKNFELAQLIKNRDKLFSIISHDLKSPIAEFHYFFNNFHNKIVGIEDVRKINQKISYLNHTVDNLLIWSLQQTKGFVLQIKNENISELIEDVLNSFASQFEAKKISVIRKIEQIYAHVDERKIEIVIRNLITNAIKFTPDAGFIKVLAHLNQGFVEINIIDTGIGMSPLQIEKAFEGLYSKIGTKGEQGTGLGLIICAEFIHLHNGTISIESNTNEGTKVIIRIPQ